MIQLNLVIFYTSINQKSIHWPKCMWAYQLFTGDCTAVFFLSLNPEALHKLKKEVLKDFWIKTLLKTSWLIFQACKQESDLLTDTHWLYFIYTFLCNNHNIWFRVCFCNIDLFPALLHQGATITLHFFLAFILVPDVNSCLF